MINQPNWVREIKIKYLIPVTCEYVVGYFLNVASVSKLLGNLLKMSSATSPMTSSSDFPPDDEARA